MRHVHVTVTGTVQGVSYRAWTQERAEGLGLRGWVRNCADGSVEAVLSGSGEAVEDMLRRMQAGPPAADVRNVEATECKPDLPEGFEIRR